MYKKKLVALVAMVLAAALFVSCAEEPVAPGGDVYGGGAETAPDAEEYIDMRFVPELPDADFDGYIFRILNTENESIPWLLTQLGSEEETGDVFNDAVFRRNRIIEARYNIEIDVQLVPNFGQVNTMARTNIRAGDDTFDLYMLSHGYAFTHAQDGHLIDYVDIPYVDLSKHYWDQDMVRDLSIGGRLFTMSGDFSFTHYSATKVMFFNKVLHTDLGLADPYQKVRDGEWTFDAFHQMARVGSRDLNGDGIMDYNDQFGYMSLGFLIYPTFMIAAGERFVAKDAYDFPVLAAGGDRWVSVFSAMLDIMYDGDILYDADRPGRDHRHQDFMFPGNQALFWTELMNWARILRDMEADFGILPHPKFNAEQENYYSIVFGSSFMGVPVTTVDIERTGIILEALTAESRRLVHPAYYDIVLQTMTARDEESGEMLDIIFSNRVYDLGHQFFSGVAVNPFNNIANLNSRDVSAVIERYYGRIETALLRTIERFEEID